MQDFLTNNHQLLLATLAAVLGSGGVSLVTQWLKKAAKLENSHVIQLLFAAVAFAAAGLQYLTTSHNLPPSVLGVHTAVLVGLGSQWYSHIVKPLSDGLTALKQADPSAVSDELKAVSESANAAANNGAVEATVPAPVTVSTTTIDQPAAPAAQQTTASF